MLDWLLTLPGSIGAVAILLLVICLSAWVFNRSIAATASVSPARVSSWELFIKAASTLAVIVAGLMAFLKYIDQREMELTQQTLQSAQTARDANIRLYSQSGTLEAARRVFFNEATDLAATLATVTTLKGPDGAIARGRFERLYHGQLVLYESDAVASAMVNFRDALLKWERTGTKPTELAATERTTPASGDLKRTQTNSDFLRQLALALAGACRQDLERTKSDG